MSIEQVINYKESYNTTEITKTRYLENSCFENSNF